MTGDFVRGKKREVWYKDTGRHTGKKVGVQKQSSYEPRSAEDCWQPRQARRERPETKSPSELTEVTYPVMILILDLISLASRTVGEYISVLALFCF